MQFIEVVETGAPLVLIVDKPVGPTSHEVVDFVRWALRTRAVGHCGTLDPAASGVLVVCVGAATKLAPYLTGVDKRYRAAFVLGRATTTADAQGETTAEAPVRDEHRRAAAEVVAGLVGEHELAPPAYSAVKVQGQAAHRRAREGQAPVLAVRPMAVREVSDVAPDEDRIEATLLVSKGTYIRSLAEEVGRRLGVPAHLGALRRTACGKLTLDHSHAVGPVRATPRPPAPGGKPRHRLRIEDVDDDRDAQARALRGAAIEPAAALPIDVVQVDEDTIAGLAHGRAQRAWTAALPVGLFAVAGQGALIIVERDDDEVRPRRVITPPRARVAPGAEG